LGGLICFEVSYPVDSMRLLLEWDMLEFWWLTPRGLERPHMLELKWSCDILVDLIYDYIQIILWDLGSSIYDYIQTILWDLGRSSIGLHSNDPMSLLVYL
jgi:hypothetical protein